MRNVVRVITLLLGGFATQLIYTAMDELRSENIEDIGEALEVLFGSAILLFFHLGVLIFAFPFLLYSLSGDRIPFWFAIGVAIESGLSAYLAYVIFNPGESGDNSGYGIIALELIPVFLLLLKINKIN